MSRWNAPLSPETRALLDHERAIPPVPAPVRARLLARARAALVAGRVTPPAGFSVPPRSRARWGIALAAACIAGAAIAATAYEIGMHRRPTAGDHPAATATNVVVTTPAPSMTPPSALVVPSAAPPPVNRSVRASQGEPGPDELRLLRQARSAVARQDFAAALPLITEHARRFKDGRLAEEREALRVRALSGLGHKEEARRAADAFESRFPRSVLLPAVEKMPASEP